MAEQLSTHERQKLNKYLRGTPINTKRVTDLKLKKQLQRSEKKVKDAAIKAMDAEILLTEERGYLEAEGMEKTFKFTQNQIQSHLDVTTSKKAFHLRLDNFGPYSIDYTRNGRYMIIGGKAGHLATFEWKTGRLGSEVHVRDPIRDVKWLHNETMYATAQKNHVYVYDYSGAELHCLKNHLNPRKLDFLPHHFLLCSVGDGGILRYQDTSTGSIVAEHRTRLGGCFVMEHNPWNAIINLGHANGQVTMWSPNMSQPLVKILCHKSPVSSLAIDQSGHYMVTTGLDGKMKVWDVRKYQELHEYYTLKPAKSVAISQKGLLAVGYGAHVSVWKNALKVKQTSPYMNHVEEGAIVNQVKFCSFDDILGVGHSRGISSLIIPGAGEPNFDALEVNPFETRKQQRESEVRSLLSKVQPDMIVLNPDDIGKVNRFAVDIPKEDLKIATFMPPKELNKKRGRSKAMNRLKRKQHNVIDAKREALRLKLKEMNNNNDDNNNQREEDDLPYALKRFNKQKK